MPAGYRELLLRSDGLDVDGMRVFGTRDKTLQDGVQESGVLEFNRGVLLDFDSTLRFVGEHDDTRLAYDQSDGTWKVVDAGDWDPDGGADVFDSFEELVTTMMKWILGDLIWGTRQ